MPTAADYGFATPAGTDLISGGDNAITQNANKTAEALTAIGTQSTIGNDMLEAGFDDVFTFPQGQYTIPNQYTANQISGLPEATPGIVNVSKNYGSPVASIVFYPHGREHHWETQTLNVSGAWVPWRQHTGGSPDPAANEDLAHLHNVRRAEFKRRRGGRIGTAGRAAIALRWDHGLVNFRDKILPHLRRLGLPGSMAMNSAGNRWILSESNGVSPEDLESYAITSGVDVWNHSQTHGPAETAEALRREIETGRAELQTKLPRIPIEGFVIPGVPSGNYAGFSAGETISRWNTTAGRYILGSHAVSSSHIDGTDMPITGDQVIISRQYSIDSLDANTVISAIDRAIQHQAGMAIFLHPSQLDLSGRMSSADYVRILEHLADRRADGDLDVITMSGLSVADSTTDYRHDLVYDPTFERGLEAWGNDDGFAVESEGSVTSGSSSAYLTQSVDLAGREWAQGSPRMLEVEYRGRDETRSLSIEIKAGEAIREISHEFAPSEWRKAYLPVIVPLNASSVPISVRRLNGTHIHVRSIRFVSI